MENRLACDVVGNGARIVLAHGFTQTGRSWTHLTDSLAAANEVMIVDLPGHGDSAEIRANLDEGAEMLGAVGGRGTYIGYSMGGRLALHLAIARPDLVSRLVVLGATGGLDSEAERSERRRADELLALGLERDGLDEFLERWLSNPLFERLPHDLAALADRRRNTVAGLASSLRLTGTGTQRPLWSELGALDMPVLVLAGEHDAKFRVLGTRLADSIGTNATFALVPEAGHAAHLEQPDAFLKIVLQFLAAHRSTD